MELSSAIDLAKRNRSDIAITQTLINVLNGGHPLYVENYNLLTTLKVGALTYGKMFRRHELDDYDYHGFVSVLASTLRQSIYCKRDYYCDYDRSFRISFKIYTSSSEEKELISALYREQAAITKTTNNLLWHFSSEEKAEIVNFSQYVANSYLKRLNRGKDEVTVSFPRAIKNLELNHLLKRVSFLSIFSEPFEGTQTFTSLYRRKICISDSPFAYAVPKKQENLVSLPKANLLKNQNGT